MAVPQPPREARHVGAARRPYPRLSSSPLVEVNGAQAHLQTRFEGLAPEDVSNKSFALYSSQHLAPPLGFEHIWLRSGFHHQAQGDVSAEERQMLHSAAFVLVLFDITQQSHVADVEHLTGFLKSVYHGQDQLRMLLVQHSDPAPPPSDGDKRYFALTRLLRGGISDAILDEPASFKLAWAVRNKLLQRRIASQYVTNVACLKADMLEHRNAVKSWVDDTIWNYLRVRLDSGLPRLDESIPDGVPHEIDGFELGKRVGKGVSGKGYKLAIAGEDVGEVVKVVRKQTRMGMDAIKTLGHHIEVMALFSTGDGTHPHIAKLIDIYHSRTHVFFRMEDAGSQNLFKRLSLRDRNNSRAPLSSVSVRTIMEQIASAVRHMHRARTAHFDSKPENIIIRETLQELNVKVVDFDTAVTDPILPFTGFVGTHPFIAPEIVLQGSCDPFAADIWSMAVVLLELACCVDVLDDALSLHLIHGTNRPQRRLKASKISDFFGQRGSVSRLLTHRLRPELQDLMRGVVQMLNGMLHVKGSSRWTSDKVLAIFDQF